MRRTLVAAIAAATLALGLALPASARLASSDPVRATLASAGSAAQPVRPASICPITKGGKVGLYICEYGVERVTFNGREHYFVVGSNRQIYYTWQLQPGGSAFSNWTTLGGQGYSHVDVSVVSTGLNVQVVGYNGSAFRWYCKDYRIGSGWHPWFGC
jgi:hypothetical protein